MAFNEKLQILVTADTKGAIAEFNKVGAAADRELGRTEDKLTKLSSKFTSLGTGLLVGGAVAVGGLKQLADSASAYGEQVSAATVTFGEDGVEQLEKFAEAAADTANISKTEATKAANGFATFARQAGLTGTAAVKFSTDLVQLAGDISSFRDISVEDALQALQSGLAGEGEPIRRLGGDISDVALKAELFSITGEKVTGTLTQQQKVVAINSKLFKDFELAQGDVLRTQDSLANQTRNAEANFENLKTEIGTGLVPIFSAVVGGIGDVVGSLGNIGDAEATLGGKIAGIGTAAVIATGGLSLLAGQGLKLRDTLTKVGDDGTRSLTNVGKAAGAIGLASSVVGTFFALDAAFKNLGVSSTDLKQAFDDLKAAKDLEEALDALLRATAETDNAWSDLKDLIGGQISTGGKVGINGVEVELNELRTALDNASSDSDTLRRALEALRAADISKVGSLPGAGKVPDAIALIEEYEGKLRSTEAAQQASADASLNQADATTEVTEGLTEQKTAFDRAKDALTSYDDRVAILAVNLEGLSERASAFSDAIERSTTLDDEIAVASSLGQAFNETKKTLGALPAEIDLAKLALGGYNEEQTKAIDGLLSLGDRSQDFLTTLIEQGRTQDEIRFGAAVLREEYARQLEAIGLNKQQVADYIEVLGLTPAQVETAIVLSNEETARFKIEAYQGLIERTPPEKLTTFEAAIAEGDFVAAAAALDQLAADRSVVITPVLPPDYLQKFFGAFGFGVPPASKPISFGGGRAEGGPVDAGRSYMVGEVGPELFVPRSSGTIVPNEQLRGGTLNLTQNITSADPVLTAAEVVRRQRDAEFLAGV